MQIIQQDTARQSDTTSITEDISALRTATVNGHNMTRTHMHNRADEVIADTAAVVTELPTIARKTDVSDVKSDVAAVKTDTAAVASAVPSLATGNDVTSAHNQTRNLLGDLPLVGILQNGNIRGDVAEEGVARTTTAAIHFRVIRHSLITEVRFASKAADTGTRDFRIAPVASFYQQFVSTISVYSLNGVANFGANGVKGVSVSWMLQPGEYYFLMRTNSAQGFGIGGNEIFSGALFGDFLMYSDAGAQYENAAPFPAGRFVAGNAAPWMPYFGIVFGG